MNTPPRRPPGAIDVIRVVLAGMAGIRSKHARTFDWAAVRTRTWLLLVLGVAVLGYSGARLFVHLIRSQVAG